ncbi:MAG: OprO/OprP family phosphate-selective porin [Candidatus Hydrogenedentes bacterium]|nr:OprO/OprP family phosphate-selective porin [Candidatus Hydrogenedentota bacterium]
MRTNFVHRVLSRGLCLAMVAFIIPCFVEAAAASDEIAELRKLLLENQKIMQEMKADYDKKTATLEKRIADLEGSQAAGEIERSEIQEAVLEQQTLADEVRSKVVDRVSLHGYYDFQYINANNDTVGSFIQNDLSLFIRSSTADEKWTIFSEIEFDRIDENDYLAGRGEESKNLEVETAWLEYRHNDLLRIRGGKLLLPQYWQTYNYPNLTLSTLPPLMVGNVFPATITALQVSGDWWKENELGLTYTAYVGNGGEAEQSELDRNDNKAVGGRLTFHLAGANGPAWLDKLDFSFSGYLGDDEEGRSETVLGLDTQFRAGRFEFQAELAHSNQQHNNRPRFWTSGQRGGEALGYYLQPAYRLTPRWHLFYRFDSLDLNDERTTRWDEERHTLGVNFRPRSNISLKLEWLHADPEGHRDEYDGMAASAVFNF